jgi:hypothetical protein
MEAERRGGRREERGGRGVDGPEARQEWADEDGSGNRRLFRSRRRAMGARRVGVGARGPERAREGQGRAVLAEGVRLKMRKREAAGSGIGSDRPSYKSLRQ